MQPKSSQLTRCSALAGFFKEEVDQALEEQQLDASEEVGFYLVNLLDEFAKTDAVGASLEEPLAMLLHRAVFEGRAQARMSAYRHLGDVSLYVAGLFSPLLRRRAVDIEYAIRMGASAYRTVAAMTNQRSTTVSRALQPMYVEMSDKFPALVEVLTQIGERTSLGADSPDLAELYERFARSSGPHLVKRMQAMGVMPVTGTKAEA